jgi:hypothetical protein
MDELDDITDEERALAEALAEQLSPSASFKDEMATHRQELGVLQDHAALLQLSEKWEARPAALVRGRADVLAHTKERATRQARRSRWLFWMPVPVALALLFTFTRGGMESPLHVAHQRASSPAPTEMKSSEEDGFEPLPPRYHVGQTPASLLRAQAEVLKQREIGADRNQARAALEREMRQYRGTLIASLEFGGR